MTTISKKKSAPPPKKNNEDPKKGILKRKRGGAENDEHVPRGFKRLMAFASGRPTRSGLDNGDAPKKKKKGKADEKKPAPPKPEEKSTPVPDLTIRPGERMWDFSQRVDAALPLAGLVNKQVKDGKDPLGLKVRKTKKERKMHKLYEEWRAEDLKIKEQREEEKELEEEKAMEGDGMGVTWKLDMEEKNSKGKKKKGKKSKHIGEDTGKEEDPWNEIIKKRGEAKVGLNEVAHAPPELVKPSKPGKKLLVAGAAVEVSDIPKAAGSLRQREELQGIRNDVVASYRKMMAERREAKAAAPKP